MSDYELSKHDFDIIEVVFRIYLENRPLGRDPTYEMKVRDLYDRFRFAHTAKIIYE